MLTIKVIAQETEKVIKGLEKKHFNNAKEVIAKVLEYDKERRAAQSELDNVLAQNKQLAAKIGQLMKEKNIAEAENVKAQVATLKESAKALQEKMDAAAENAIDADQSADHSIFGRYLRLYGRLFERTETLCECKTPLQRYLADTVAGRLGDHRGMWRISGACASA